MDNDDIKKILTQISSLLEIRGENVFKIRAYQNAARAIENLNEPLSEIHERGELAKIDGIGKGIAEKIAEAIETGHIAYYDELIEGFPEGILDLLEVPNLGPKKARLVYENLGISSVEELKQAAEAGQLQSLPGMGKKSEEKILKGIANMKQSEGRFHLGIAYPVAMELLERIKQVPGVFRAEFAGSLRRGKDTVGDLDLLVATDNPDSVVEEFFRTPKIQTIIAKGSKKSSCQLTNGLQIDLRVVLLESFGAALQYFTGSKEHNVLLREMAVKKGLKINEYGVYESDSNTPVAGETEESVYQSLGLPWIYPEWREGYDEIEIAKKGPLPPLLERKNIRSALHNHTTWSDGRMTLDELVEEAKARGYQFLAVTDHSGSLGVANGLNPDRLKKQIEEIQEWNQQHKNFTVLTGAEVDIRADGELDFDDSLLEQLDIVIAAIHSSFEQPKEKMTNRILPALRNPHVDILAHPTGRIIGHRATLEIDHEALFSTAAETKTILEINAHYSRLDLSDRMILEAKKHGVLFSLDTDTHAAHDFEHLEFGLRTARRGRLQAQEVINTYPLKKLYKVLGEKTG